MMYGTIKNAMAIVRLGRNEIMYREYQQQEWRAMLFKWKNAALVMRFAWGSNEKLERGHCVYRSRQLLSTVLS